MKKFTQNFDCVKFSLASLSLTQKFFKIVKNNFNNVKKNFYFCSKATFSKENQKFLQYQKASATDDPKNSLSQVSLTKIYFTKKIAHLFEAIVIVIEVIQQLIESSCFIVVIYTFNLSFL